jgi:murein L,D-transpeptidase YafK
MITKRERFVKLAEYRTNEVLKRIRVLGNCSNRGAYEYSEEEINKIFSAIDKALKETKAKFHFGKNNRFKL